ncbi:TRAP transporter small permease, partial [Halomonas eurihalina]
MTRDSRRPEESVAPAETAPPDPVRNAFDRGVVACGRIAAWLVFVAMAISV